MTDLTRPIAGDPLSSSNGKASTVILDEAFDVIEANEDAITARTSADIVTTDAFPELAAVVLHSADAVSDGTGTWTVSGGHSGAVAVLDTTNKTTGTGSVSANLDRPSGSGTDGKLYCNLVTPVSVGGHTEADIDARWTTGSGAVAEFGFELVFASGAGLTGTVVTKTLISTVPTQNVWGTAAVSLTGLTSIASFGVRKISSSAGSSSQWLTVKLDNVRLSATSAIDSALTTSPRALLVTPGFSPAAAQGVKTLGSTQALLDFRPSYSNITGFRGVKSLRDRMFDETGVRDMTAAMQAFVSSLSPGDTLISPPNAKYRMDGQVTIAVSNITIDMQGARIFETNYTGEPMFVLHGDYVTLRNWRLFGRAPNVNTAGNLLVTTAGSPVVSGSTMLLDALNEEVRVAVRDSANPEPLMTERYSRDEDGYLQFDLTLSQSTTTASDVTVTFLDHAGTTTDYTTTFTVAQTPTVYPIKFRMHDPYSRTQIRIKKATATTNTITVHNVLAYRRFAYNQATVPSGDDSTLNAGIMVDGSGCTIENYWAEGMGGDGLQIRGNDNCGLRVRNMFARGQGRECLEVSQGNDILIEDFSFAGCARDVIDIEPETSGSAIDNLRFRNGIFGTGRNVSFVSSGSDPGERMRHCTLDDIWLRVDTGTPWISDFIRGGAIRNLVYTWEGSGTPGEMDIGGNDCLIENVVSDGVVNISGSNNTVRKLEIKNVVQAGTLIVTGTGHDVSDVQIGDPEDTVTIDTSLAFNPVQLAADTTYRDIRCPTWKTEFSNSYKGAIATQLPWLPHGLDLQSGGVRAMRGISGTTTPANNLRGIAQFVTAGTLSANVTFPVRADVMNPTSFATAASGPHVTKITAKDVAGAYYGNWNVVYNGQSSAKTITGATWAAGVATFTTSTPHDVQVGDIVGVTGILPVGYRNIFSHDTSDTDTLRQFVVASIPTTTTFTCPLTTNPGAYVSGGVLGLGPDAKKAIIQRWLRSLSTVSDTDVTVTGDFNIYTGGASGGSTLTWAPTLGDLPATQFSVVDNLVTWNAATGMIKVDTTTTGGFLTSGQYYVYRVGGRTYEGMPISGPGASMAAQVRLLTAGTNSITVTFGTPLYSTTTDLKVMGTTVWRAGPFVSNPGTYTGTYTRRVDLPGTTDFNHPAGGVDRETSFSGIPWTTLAVPATTAELDQNQSGWEPDNNYAVIVTPSWPTPVAVTKTDTSLFQHHGSGFTVTFGVPAPATTGGTFDWIVVR